MTYCYHVKSYRLLVPVRVQLEKAGMAGVAFVAALAAIFVYQASAEGFPAVRSGELPLLRPAVAAGVPESVGVLSFAFYLTPMLLPLLREMPAGSVGVDLTCRAVQIVTAGAWMPDWLHGGLTWLPVGGAACSAQVGAGCSRSAWQGLAPATAAEGSNTGSAAAVPARLKLSSSLVPLRSYLPFCCLPPSLAPPCSSAGHCSLTNDDCDLHFFCLFLCPPGRLLQAWHTLSTQ